MPNFSGIWSTAQQFQARGQNIWPKPPCAPTGVTGTAGDTQVSVAFTAPSCAGKYPAGVSTYTATSTPGGFTATGASSPVVVTGLTNGTAYTFKVKATGSNGLTGPCSSASGSVTPTNGGSQSYTSYGTYSWVAPAGVTAVSVVAVGGGGKGSRYFCCCGPFGGTGGGGGGLGYKNNYAVTPGSSYTVQVGRGADGAGNPSSISYFVSCVVVSGNPGYNGAFGSPGAGGGHNGGCGGGNGGSGGFGNRSGTGGGGGSGGYGGSGGQGGANGAAGNAGNCGGGGGGGGATSPYLIASSGGGVGLFGKGTSGTGGGSGAGGGGGSGGANGNTSIGGAYGGGGGGGGANTDPTVGYGGSGAVRIIWPGNTRSFPSTCAGNP